MAHLMRKCSQCGATDTKQSWSSLDEATKQGAFDKAWTCPNCAWTEFELAEAEEEPAKA
jgi:ssDNA-binding Zn-finger/Zn-ribbon topoisomerase 1